MASGRPAVVADWGGPPELVGPGGIVVPCTSPAGLVTGLARALMDLAVHPDTRVALGRAARRHALDRFDWDRKADRLLELYEQVLTDRVRPIRTTTVERSSQRPAVPLQVTPFDAAVVAGGAHA